MRTHYEALGLSEDATVEEIKTMYKKLSLIYHPDKNSNALAAAKFKQINDAYGILTNEKSRKKYDKELCKQRKKEEENSNTLDIPKDKKLKQRPRSNQPPIRLDVFCSFKTLMEGKIKYKTIKRLEMDPKTGAYVLVKKKFELEIKPGYGDQTEIIFPFEGNQVGEIPGDVIFKIREKPHKFYHRDGNDLKYTVCLSKSDSKNGKIVKVPFLDGNSVELVIGPGQIGPDSIKRYKEKGFPDINKPNKRGDFIVEFLIFKKTCGCM